MGLKPPLDELLCLGVVMFWGWWAAEALPRAFMWLNIWLGG